MELYHNNMSVCAQKVRLVLREKNLRPAEHHLNLRAGDQTRPEYLKLNAKGVVPTLVDRGETIVESTVICEYLEDTYPDVPLMPRNSVLRARTRLWTMLPDTGLHHACGTISFAIAFRHQMLALPAEERERQLSLKPDPLIRESNRRTIELGVDAPGVPDALRLYDRVLTQMSRQLDVTPWLVGDEYTLADAALLPYVCRLEDLSCAWLWRDGRSSIARWLDRCKARPNYAAIAEYRDPKYVELLERSGREQQATIRAIVG